MVHTCAEAILIEVLPDQSNNDQPPETQVRAGLDPENFNKIVYTWAQELEFEQICSKKILSLIYKEFDLDQDGIISERDLQASIY